MVRESEETLHEDHTSESHRCDVGPRWVGCVHCLCLMHTRPVNTVTMA